MDPPQTEGIGRGTTKHYGALFTMKHFVADERDYDVILRDGPSDWIWLAKRGESCGLNENILRLFQSEMQHWRPQNYYVTGWDCSTMMNGVLIDSEYEWNTASSFATDRLIDSDLTSEMKDSIRDLFWLEWKPLAIISKWNAALTSPKLLRNGLRLFENDEWVHWFWV